MRRERSELSIKSKVWIEDGNGEVVFGSGRAQILKAIEETRLDPRRVQSSSDELPCRMGKDQGQ